MEFPFKCACSRSTCSGYCKYIKGKYTLIRSDAVFKLTVKAGESQTNNSHVALMILHTALLQLIHLLAVYVKGGGA